MIGRIYVRRKYGATLLFFSVIAVIVYVGEYRFRSTPEYATAKKFIAEHNYIIERLGEIDSIKYIEGVTTVREGEDSIDAVYRFRVSGKLLTSEITVWVFDSSDCDKYTVMVKIHAEGSKNENERVFCQ